MTSKGRQPYIFVCVVPKNVRKEQESSPLPEYGLHIPPLPPLHFDTRTANVLVYNARWQRTQRTACPLLAVRLPLHVFLLDGSVVLSQGCHLSDVSCNYVDSKLLCKERCNWRVRMELWEVTGLASFAGRRLYCHIWRCSSFVWKG